MADHVADHATDIRTKVQPHALLSSECRFTFSVALEVPAAACARGSAALEAQHVEEREARHAAEVEHTEAVQREFLARRDARRRRALQLVLCLSPAAPRARSRVTNLRIGRRRRAPSVV